MQKYKYKESGIQWLGNIPQHWKTTKIKNEFVVIPSNVDKRIEEDETPVKLCNYVDVYYNDFITNNIEFMEATATDHEINKFILNEGDVLITKDSEDPFDIAVPAVVKETQEKLLCGYHLSMIRSINKKISGEFLFWLLKDQAIVSQLHREAVGVTRWAIASKHIKNSIVSHPPIKEQKIIAEYLEKTCQRIETIIKIKEKQIETLMLLYRSEVYKSCTKGLSDNVKYKISDIDYINKYPEHWKVIKVKRACEKIDTGGTPSTSTPEYYENGSIRWYAPESFNETITIDAPKKLINELALIEKEIKMFPKGSVFFVGVGATVGKVGVIRNEASCNQQINILQTNYKLLPDFLAYHFKLLEKEIIKFAQYTTLPILNQTKTGYISIALPPVSEQIEIVNHLNVFSNKTFTTRSKIEAQIEVIKLYRSSIIHECVTGKKQVADIAVEKVIKRAMA